MSSIWVNPFHTLHLILKVSSLNEQLTHLKGLCQLAVTYYLTKLLKSMKLSLRVAFACGCCRCDTTTRVTSKKDHVFFFILEDVFCFSSVCSLLFLNLSFCIIRFCFYFIVVLVIH